ncbi:MAG: branched-chain amino acid ABC transporter permease [Gammaproteobacteria bacterium]|nr:branched-chain amino acid ABC transporter permease [Gammaproteobacteria bacterium]MDD9799685.1 branched-chain amino acid ABC transporter permease [Gammaproteobacteria bacterium]MDD9814497.1 branched-chain amino acid ABC transporter permease [Gammaproteobacteria bacterium]MDD9850226.1 branched-chain amino acid ABC transporter permease [Gammaproteobacteria bacterium]MDD9871830.1 branched-chain amino acid ABC transporter permease [Gammaproteobacteria bacterium]
MDAYHVTVLSNIGMISLIALSAYLLLVCGEISFGQQAYFGIGAYISGIATAMWGWPLWSGMLAGGLIGASAAAFVGALTLRINGFYFSIATLAFAEMMRLLLYVFRYQVEIGGELVGPDGENGFHGIRWIFENDISTVEFMWIIYGVLASVVAGMMFMERSRLGRIFRMIGQDDMLARMQGVNVLLYKVLAALIAGFIAGVGGSLYAHSFTYIEPQFFNVMLGVHGLAYGLIGGLGVAFGPLVGVAIDIGFLEAIRWIQGYRMIAFGGLVAVMLIFWPRGIFDEKRWYSIRRCLRRMCGAETS